MDINPEKEIRIRGGGISTNSQSSELSIREMQW